MTEAQGIALLASTSDLVQASQHCFAALCACFGVGIAIIVAVTWKG